MAGNTALPVARNGVPAVEGRVAPVPGDDLRDDSKWDEDGFLKEPDAAMIEAAAAAASASSIARWNQQQRQEQEQRLRQLMVEMKDAIKGGGGGGGGGDADGCRPTLRRGSSSVDSRGSSASGGGNVSGRGSISGSGMWNTSDPHTRALFLAQSKPILR